MDQQKRIDEETAFLIDLERRAGVPEAQPRRKRRRKRTRNVDRSSDRLTMRSAPKDSERCKIDDWVTGEAARKGGRESW